MSDINRLAAECMGWSLFNDADMDLHFWGIQLDNGYIEATAFPDEWDPEYNLEQAFMLVRHAHQNKYDVLIIADDEGWFINVSSSIIRGLPVREGKHRSKSIRVATYDQLPEALTRAVIETMKEEE